MARYSKSKETSGSCLPKFSRMCSSLSVLCFISAYSIRKLGLFSTHENQPEDLTTSVGNYFYIIVNYFSGASSTDSLHKLKQWIDFIAELSFHPVDILFNCLFNLSIYLEPIWLQVCDYLKINIDKVNSTDIVNRTVNLFTPSIQTMEEDQFHSRSHYVAVLIAVIVIICTLSAAGYTWIANYKREKKDKKKLKNRVRAFFSKLSPSKGSSIEIKPSNSPWWKAWHKIIASVVILSVLLSIPWEFMRIYEEEYAKRVATSAQGIPPECDPNSMSVWQTTRSFMRWVFVWDEEKCQKYHKAVLVDPLWEVTPMMVVSSAITRSITKPIEIVSSSTGRAMTYLCSEIPILWQPFVLIFIACIIILGLLMVCGYRVSIPLCFSMEPTQNPGPPRPVSPPPRPVSPPPKKIIADTPSPEPPKKSKAISLK